MLRDILKVLELAGSAAGAALNHKQRSQQREASAADLLLRRQAWELYIAAGGTDLVSYIPPPNHPEPDRAWMGVPVDLLGGNTAPKFFAGDAQSGYRVDPMAVARHNARLKEFAESEAHSLQKAAELARAEAAHKLQHAKAEKRRRELIEASVECDSPVETMFLRAIVAEYEMSFSDGAFRGNGIVVKKQACILNYRVDFLINNALVVEIDGHEFHSGRENANRDARRDERLRARGYRLLRIPAYRVHHNPSTAVSDVRDFLLVLQEERTSNLVSRVAEPATPKTVEEDRTFPFISNCRYAYKCDRIWHSLTAVPGDSSVRYCGQCQKSVHLCKTNSEVVAHARQGHCIAIRIDSCDEFMGDVPFD